jgi:uncharacterized pyridoxamine 5'-phosphate oxidase family protein
MIASVRKNGSPHAAWNPFAFVENRLYIYADPNLACYKNIVRDPRVALAITSREMKGIAVFSIATSIRTLGTRRLPLSLEQALQFWGRTTLRLALLR